MAGPQRIDRLLGSTALEVILVNARSAESPTAPQAVAQANLAGGGNGAAAGRPTSPLPPGTVLEFGDAPQDARRQSVVDELQRTQTRLLAQLRREAAMLPLPDPQQRTEEQATPEAVAQEEHRRVLLDQLAEIEKRVNEHAEGRRRRYVGPSAREAAYAQYYDRLRRRVEERGTRDFPAQGGKKLYGELTMNITIDADGQVVETEIVRASSSGQLDRRAVAIVKAAAPFGPFTPAMRKQADELVVTSRFRFTHDDGLETSLAAPR